MDVNEIRNAVQYFANKHQSGNTFSPVEYNLLLPLAQYEFIRQRLGLPQDYHYGQPFPRIAYNISRKVEQDLSPWWTQLPLAVAGNGLAVRPPDIFYPIALRYPYTKTTVCENGMEKKEQCEASVELVDETEWGERICSAINQPVKKYPIAKFNDTTIELAPRDLGRVQLVYFRKPVQPVFAYTIDSNDDELYDAANSVQLEIPEDNHIEVVRILLGYAGIHLQSAEILNYAEQKKIQGI